MSAANAVTSVENDSNAVRNNLNWSLILFLIPQRDKNSNEMHPSGKNEVAQEVHETC